MSESETNKEKIYNVVFYNCQISDKAHEQINELIKTLLKENPTLKVLTDHCYFT